MELGREQQANQRLLEFFRTFKGDEPLAVTKNRVDLTKGFVDTSNEGADLTTLLAFQKDDPRAKFTLFEDGFHTPAFKRPSHPSFRLNSIDKQAVTQAQFPEDKLGDLTKIISDQLLDVIGQRKNGK